MNGLPLFDRATYFELSAGLGEDDTAEVLKVFLADTAGKMRSLASGQQSRSTIRREAHSIKSSAATFGFAELSALARGLELRAEAMSPEQLNESVEALRQAFESVSNLADAQLPGSSTEIA
jgi:histidine phosphotransfer protein HptB